MKEKAKITLFKYLTIQEINWLLTRFQPQHVDANTVIIKEGTAGDEMFIIKSGRVEVFLTRGKVFLLLSEIHEPMFFGEIAFLANRTHWTTFKAKTDCQFLVLKKQDFMNIIDENPRIAAKFLRALGEGLGNQIIATDINLENYFLINQNIVDNELFKKLYILTQKALSSSG